MSASAGGENPVPGTQEVLAEGELLLFCEYFSTKPRVTDPQNVRAPKRLHDCPGQSSHFTPGETEAQRWGDSVKVSDQVPWFGGFNKATSPGGAGSCPLC